MRFDTRVRLKYRDSEPALPRNGSNIKSNSANFIKVRQTKAIVSVGPLSDYVFYGLILFEAVRIVSALNDQAILEQLRVFINGNYLENALIVDRFACSIHL